MVIKTLKLDTVNEISHAFILPSYIRNRLGDYNPSDIEEELNQIQNEIDDIAFELYGFTEQDRLAIIEEYQRTLSNNDSDDEDDSIDASDTETLLSWAVGVAFGRFDIRLAIGERELQTSLILSTLCQIKVQV